MFTAIRFTILILLLAGIVYPLALTGLGQLLFPHQANGSMVQNEKGKHIGSELIGQAFTRPEYFHPRPSVNGYDAANTGGSNLGATSQKLADRMAKEAPASKSNDALTASSSNVDPHISLDNAMAQAYRISEARKTSVESTQKLVHTLTESDLAESPYVNVLQLNRALDKTLGASR